MTSQDKTPKQSLSEKYAEKLAELKQDYCKKLPSKIAQIEQLWQKLRYFNWSDEAFQTLHLLAHTLHGSGKTFGFDELSEHAKNLEHYLKNKIQSAKQLDETEYQEISDLIQALANALQNPDETSEASETPPKPKSLDQQSIASHAQYVIYLVDDDVHTAEYLAQQLINGGFQVVIYHSIKELYKALESNTPDVVLMDIIFPEGSLAGIEAVDKIRQTVGKRIPILFMSARSDVTARLQALRAGGDGYFSKPIDIEPLIHKLEEIMLSRSTDVERILLVEDDEDLAKHYQLVLQNAGKEVRIVTKPMSTIQELEEFLPNLVLMDINMPGVSGLDLATLINQEGRFIGLPIIFISAANAAEIKARALSIGGDEFLSKPVADQELIEAVNRGLLKSRRMKRTIKQVSRKDPLSGLIHRKSFLADLEQAIAKSDTEQSSAALIYITIESFDAIRAQIGLAELDPLASVLAQRILQPISNNAKASQLAESVYVVLAESSDQIDVPKLAEAIMQSITQTSVSLDPHKIDIQCGIGFSYLSNELTDVTALLADAEHAAAKATKKGVNQIQQSERSDSKESADYDKKLFDDKVKRAINEKSLRLVFQPILNVEDDEFEFYEVLCRLIDENNKVLLPEQFVPVVEQLNLHEEIDRWTVNQSVIRINENIRTRTQTNFLIQISTDTIAKPSFVPWLSNCLSSSKTRGERQFLFEMSEAKIVTRVKEVAKFSSALKELNCGFVINDFGSTDSSINLLDQLNIDYVKLSGLKISQLEENDNTKKELKLLIKSIQAKGIKIIAGSVENPLTMALLWDWGVRFFQGQYIEEPHESLEFDFSRAVEHRPF
jgi:multidomain signaling protein FimX